MDHAARHGRTASAPSCCYGKIPTLGDFIHRGLSRRQIDVWDQWLQGCVAAGRDALGERWLDFYLEAPVWYFAAAPGNLDQQTWMGVLIPSVDRVGRYFPFSILRKFEAGTPLGAMRSGQSWFGEAEQLAMDCLEDTFEPGDLDSRLAQLPDPSDSAGGASANNEGDPADPVGRVFLLGQAPGTNEVLSAIADDSLLQLHATYSIWWTAGSSAVPASLLVTGGLPEFAAFAPMLDGRFENYGWAGFRRLGAPPVADEAADEHRGF